jgi:hypothetical protein
MEGEGQSKKEGRGAEADKIKYTSRKQQSKGDNFFATASSKCREKEATHGARTAALTCVWWMATGLMRPFLCCRKVSTHERKRIYIKLVIVICGFKKESQQLERRAGQGGWGGHQLSHGAACNGHVDFQTIADDGGGDHLEAAGCQGCKARQAAATTSLATRR